MVRKLRNLLVRFVLWFLDGPIAYEISDSKEKEQIRRWMIDCYAHPGYQAFFKYRHSKMIKELSSFGMEDQPRDNYIRKIGQRFEMLRWHQLMGQVFNADAKKFREKIQEDKAP